MNQKSSHRFSLKTLFIVLTIVSLFLGLVGTRIHRARQEAMRRNNLFRIAMAFLIYHDQHGSFPPAYSTDESGKPMHSWRALLLSVMSEPEIQKTFRSYNYNQPWDSPANQAVAANMPDVYRNPFLRESSQTTSYMVITGPGTLFEGDKTKSFRDVTDGTSNTVLVVEVANSKTQWTEPRDLDIDTMPRDFDASNQQECISGLLANGAMIATVDGSVHYLDQDLAAETLQNLLLRNDSNPGPYDKLRHVD